MTERVNYYFSLGYLSNEGIVRGNEYSAVRANMKLDAKVTDWFSVVANVNFQNRSDGDIAVDWYRQITSNSPFATPYNEVGELVAHPQGENAYWKGYNFDFDRQYLDLEKGFTVLNTILTAKLTLPFGITYSFNAAPRLQYFYDRYYRSSEHPDWQAETDDRVNREQSKRFDWSLNNTITWDYTFAKKHHTILTLVQEAEERQSWADRIQARNILPSEALGFHGTANGDKSLSDFRSTDNRETACGYLLACSIRIMISIWVHSLSDVMDILLSVRPTRMLISFPEHWRGRLPMRISGSGVMYWIPVSCVFLLDRTVTGVWKTLILH